MLKHFVSLSLIVLFVSAASFALDDIRIIPVKVCYAESWLKWHGSRAITRTQKVVDRVSRIYEREFGIKLQVDTAELIKIDSGNQKDKLASDIETLTQQLVPPQDGGIVICFSSKSYVSRRVPHLWGQGRVDKIGGNYMLISDEKEDVIGLLHTGASRNKLVAIGVHELAHLLDCRHAKERDSIMYAEMYLSNFSFVFDAESKKMIMHNKWIAFTKQSDAR